MFSSELLEAKTQCPAKTFWTFCNLKSILVLSIIIYWLVNIFMITDSLFYAEKKPIKKVALLFIIPMQYYPL